MNEEKKAILVPLVIGSIFVLGFATYFLLHPQGRYFFSGTRITRPDDAPVSIEQSEIIVEETLELPATQKVMITSGSTVREKNPLIVPAPLVPEKSNYRLVVPLARYTLKEAYEKALPIASGWRSDLRLSFIKSLGAVTSDGKSSQWQVVFISGSRRGKAYEVVIQADAVVSQKEVASAAFGGVLPKTWFDSGEAIRRLGAMPQFEKGTLSGINLFYSSDAGQWRYLLATNSGNTTLEL